MAEADDCPAGGAQGEATDHLEVLPPDETRHDTSEHDPVLVACSNLFDRQEAAVSALLPALLTLPRAIREHRALAAEDLLRHLDSQSNWLLGMATLVDADLVGDSWTRIVRQVREAIAAQLVPAPSRVTLHDQLRAAEACLGLTFASALRGVSYRIGQVMAELGGHEMAEPAGQQCDALYCLLGLAGLFFRVQAAPVAVVAAALVESLRDPQPTGEAPVEEQIAAQPMLEPVEADIQQDTEVSEAVVPVESEAYRFERIGDIWHLQWKLERGVYPDCRGLQVINHLLARPNRCIEALDLGNYMPHTAARKHDPGIDEDALREIVKEALGLKRDYEETGEESILQQLDPLLKQLSKDIGSTIEIKNLEIDQLEKILCQFKRKKPRSDADRAAEAASKAVKRCKKEIENKMKGLAAHLQTSIKKIGTTLGYFPSADFSAWTT